MPLGQDNCMSDPEDVLVRVKPPFQHESARLSRLTALGTMFPTAGRFGVTPVTPWCP